MDAQQPPKKEDVVKGLVGIGGALGMGAALSKVIPAVGSDWAKAHPTLRGGLYAAGLSAGGLLTRLGVDAARESEARRTQVARKVASLGNQPKPTNLAQDFAAGMDPFGTFTGGYGQRNQQAGISEKQHRLKSAVSTTGGMLGGAVLIPGAIGGIVDGARGVISTPGGVGKRLSAGLRGAVSGAKSPFEALGTAMKARRALRLAQEGKVLSPAEVNSVVKTLGKASVGDVLKKVPADVIGGAKDAINNPLELMEKAREFSAMAKNPQQLGAKAREFLDLAGGAQLEELSKNKATAKVLEGQVGEAVNRGMSQLALGAGFGGLGAYVPYQMGRKSEIEFQNRQQAAAGTNAASLVKLAKARDLPSFTRQDRPEKVKEIYRALKRDHPNWPAGKKARIANAAYNRMEKKAMSSEVFSFCLTTLAGE